MSVLCSKATSVPLSFRAPEGWPLPAACRAPQPPPSPPRLKPQASAQRPPALPQTLPTYISSSGHLHSPSQARISARCLSSPGFPCKHRLSGHALCPSYAPSFSLLFPPTGLTAPNTPSVLTPFLPEDVSVTWVGTWPHLLIHVLCLHHPRHRVLLSKYLLDGGWIWVP